MNRISITLASVLLAAAHVAAAQEHGDNRPQTGDIEVSLVLGNSTMFSEDVYHALKPTYEYRSKMASTGIDSENSQSGDLQSEDPGYYLNLRTVTDNSLVNMVGVQGRYYIMPQLDVNLMFSMNIAVTPKRDFRDGDYSLENMPVPSHRYVEGRIRSNWMTNVGGAWHFSMGGGKINAYAGVQFGLQMARLQTTTPYTGAEAVKGEEGIQDVAFGLGSTAGQVYSITPSIVGGVQACTSIGLTVGIEMSPFAYQYTKYQVGPKGHELFEANHKNVKIFSTPQLKIGFRF